MNIHDLRHKVAVVDVRLKELDNLSKMNLSESNEYVELIKRKRALVTKLHAAEQSEAEVQRAFKEGRHTKNGDGFSSDEKEFAQGFRDVFRGGIGSEKVIKLTDPAGMLQGRAAVTPATDSAGKYIVQSTSSTIEHQPSESVAFLDRVTILNGQPNNSRHAYTENNQVPTPQQQNPAYTGSLSEQNFSVNAFTLTYEANHTYVPVHNDVLRDAAGNFENVILNLSRRGHYRKMGYDLLFGGTNFSGMATYGQQLTQGAVISDYTPLIKAKRLHGEANYNWTNPIVIMHPAVDYQFAGLVSDTEGQPLQPAKQITDIVMSANWYSTSVIPTTGGTGSTKMFVLSDPRLIKIYLDGEYAIQLVEKLAEKDQTIFKITWRWYAATEHPNSVVVINDVRKGNNIT